MSSSFDFLVDLVVESVRPVPPLDGFSLNANCKDWVPGRPIPEDAVCIRMLSFAHGEVFHKIRTAEGSLLPHTSAALLLAGMCDAKGQPYVPELPPTDDGLPSLAYDQILINRLNARLPAPLADHIRICISEFSGWITPAQSKFITNPIEDTAKN
jgi:hypothetical protein